MGGDRAKKVAAIAILSSLSIATNYALVGLANVKLMDLVVFIGGYCFGLYVGAIVGALSWLVYGLINPHGFVLPVWFSTMFAETIYGLVGALLKRRGLKGSMLKKSIVFGAAGFLSTVVYDIVTNVVYAASFGLPVVATILVGFPFTVVHEASNLELFALVAPPLTRILERSGLITD